MRVSMMTDDDVLLDSVAAAKFLATPQRTLEGWRCAKTGPPYIKYRGKVRYLRSALVRYLEDHTVHPVDDDAAVA
jgi:hypothetical protein